MAKSISKILGGATLLSLVTVSSAFAGGTSAGTNVSNTFRLEYQIGSTPQPPIDTGPGGSNTPTLFTVDRQIDLTVTSSGNTTVAPGAQDQELLFSVVNNGNDTQAYNFVLVNETGDNFNTTGLNITVYVDDGDKICNATDTGGSGTAYTPGSGAATVDVDADDVLCIVVDGDIGAGQTDTQTSQVSLVADTLDNAAAGNGVVTGDSDGNNLVGIAENVLGDGSGTANEAVNQGDHSATGTYVVASANLGATKAVTVFSEDGSNCSTIPGTPASGDQYSVPGACVEYVITVQNSGSTSASITLLRDILPGDLTYITAAVSTQITGGSLTQPATSSDCGAVTCTVELTGASIAASQTGTLTIRAIVK